jgi:hypothetical protein
VASLAPAPARALEAFDGALQVHGYAEAQARVLAKNYQPSDGYHLAQWWNILNVEAEWDVAPNGFGPFDQVSAYVRGEVRYDCVWTGGCYMLPAYRNRYGDQARRLPRHLSDAGRSGMIGVIEPGDFADRRHYIQVPIDELPPPYGAPAGLDQPAPNQQHLGFLWDLTTVGRLFFGTPGPDDVLGTADDPGLYVAQNFLDYRFALKAIPGSTGGRGTQELGPWRPRDDIPSPGALRNIANPFRGPCPTPYDPLTSPAVCDLRPPLGGVSALGGQGDLPFRPAPSNPYATIDPAIDPHATALPLAAGAQGLYVPNAGFLHAIRRGDFRLRPDENFSESQLAWNHGASQQPWDELKEAYLDIEMFDHRLWLRIGRQTIVWGKTELFRAQDQFNPQDLALSSLPTLEESRVPLWSTRAIWSFYDFGPIEDVRLELAMNWDEFHPDDLGRCGEPYAPTPTCTRAFGIFADSLVGTGVAGEFRWGWPWEDSQSLEGGARVEFRTDRVSYAITWFNGLDDLPYTKPVFVFARNVDPFTGRPRFQGTSRPCDPAGVLGRPDTSGCFGSVDAAGVQTPDNQVQALVQQPGNLQLFTTLCAATVTTTTLAPEACAVDAWNSTAIADPTNPLSPTISMAFSAMLAGQAFNTAPFPGPFRSLNGKLVGLTLGRFVELAGAIPSSDSGGATMDEDDIPFVPLDRDPGDPPVGGSPSDRALFDQRLQAHGVDPASPAGTTWNAWSISAGLSQYLTPEQQALLGCGPFWGTHCDVDGIDLYHTEASAFFQSWPGFEGTGGGVWLTNDASHPQPGTVGFVGGPVCTRNVGGQLVILPGCRGPGDPGYQLAVDGSQPAQAQNNPMVTPRDGVPGASTPAFLPGQPFTGQTWQSEMAAVSWNALITFVLLSVVDAQNDDGVLPDGRVCGVDAVCVANDGLDDSFEARGQPGRFDEFNPRDPYNPNRCSFVNTTICKNVNSLLAVSAAGKRTVRAAGNERFGRRDFVWHGGAQIALDYQRRNVVGFAFDFAEDRTQSNWNAELTYFDRVQFADNDSPSLHSDSGLVNLVISVDRPTFIRFLNRSRTFFINGQVFFQYVTGYRDSYTANGPFNTLLTIGVFTGYHQDRLLPSLQLVYDVNSASGAVLWSFGYRVNERFSVQVGANSFFGTIQRKEAPLLNLGTAGGGGAGQGAQHSFVENGLSVVRDRDELFMSLRYTF